MARKTQLVLFDRSNINGAIINVKMDGSVLEEKSYFKMLGLSFFLLNWIGALTLSPLRSNCLQVNQSLDSFYEVSFS